MAAGVLDEPQVAALGKGKALRKAFSTMFHTLPLCPFSDADIAQRLLHTRKMWQAAYTITACARHRAAWSALASATQTQMSFADIVRL